MLPIRSTLNLINGQYFLTESMKFISVSACKTKPNSANYDIVLPCKTSERKMIGDSIIKPSYWLTGIPKKAPQETEIKSEKQLSAMRESCLLASKILKFLEGYIKVQEWILRRDKFGAYSQLMSELSIEDPAQFSNFLRIKPACFEKLACRIGPLISKQDTKFRKAISETELLVVTLRFLASGDSYSSLSYLFRIPKCRISLKVPEVCRAIMTALKEDYIKVGITTDDIDNCVHTLCIENSAYPSPLNYHNYPKSVCTSVNNVACHGIPDSRALKSGDILNVDVTVFRNHMHGDCSAMFCLGTVDEKGIDLCNTTKEALLAGISVCKPGRSFSDIGKIIQKVAEGKNYTVVPAFLGHGIGSYFHGLPDIYHFDTTNTKYYSEQKMEAGMTFTIEPVLSEGSNEIVILEDGWTAITTDSSRTAQWEHTVLITNDGVEVLTI